MTSREASGQAGALAAESLDAGYGRLQILRGVDLTINVGETVAILGANGAGKTTLVRALTGFADITSGTVKLENVVLTKMRPHNLVRLGVVQVPEGRRLFPSLTVEGNLDVAFYARRRTLSNQRQDELLESAYELFPRLYERRAQLARSLSGGEQQMLAIARTVLLEPKILILDEPSTGLAPLLVDTIFDAIKQLGDAGHSGVLVVEQSPAILDLVDRAYVLKAGRVVTHGDAADVRSMDLAGLAYLGTQSDRMLDEDGDAPSM